MQGLNGADGGDGGEIDDEDDKHLLFATQWHIRGSGEGAPGQHGQPGKGGGLNRNPPLAKSCWRLARTG